MRTTASQTGHDATNSADAGKLSRADRTPIEKAAPAFGHCERQTVTTLFVTNSEIATGLPPFGAMGQDPPAAGTKLGQNMSQFMPQRPIYLARMMDELRIKSDHSRPIIRAPGSGFQSRIPFHAKFVCDARCAMRTKE
jgi:hypothetical protein